MTVGSIPLGGLIATAEVAEMAALPRAAILLLQQASRRLGWSQPC